MRVTGILRMEAGDVPVAKITGHGDIELELDTRIGAPYNTVMIPPAQAEAIVNALVEALAALKVPK